jgi:outer membrane translocation and assembly module TamA
MRVQALVQGTRPRLALFTTAVAMTCCACHAIPGGRAAIYGVEVRSVDTQSTKLDLDDVNELLATAPSPKFLSLVRGIVYNYTFFDRGTLQRDLKRVEAYCREHGYYEAHVRAGRVIYQARDRVRVEILVEVGEPVLTNEPSLTGANELSERTSKALRRALYRTLPVGEPFEQAKFEEAKTDLTRALQNQGFAYAKVESVAWVDLISHTANVSFSIDPGLPMRFGDISVEGLKGLSPSPVRAVMGMRSGDRYEIDAIDSARQAILDLGVFSTVEIAADLANARGGLVPIKVSVEPSRLRSVRAGFGVELDVLRADVHGRFGWEHRNFLGHLRVFSVEIRPGLVLFPLRVNNLVAPSLPLLENRLKLELRERGLFNTVLTGFVRPQLDIYPVLLDPNPKSDVPVLGYGELRFAVGADVVLSRFYVALSHNVQVSYPFSYSGPLDDTLTTIAISYPELRVQLDLRDNRIRPRRGLLFGVGFQSAGGPFLGDARDIKVAPEIRGYLPLGKRAVFAVRLGFGLLFPRNYGEAVTGDPGQLSPRDRTRDYQLTFFRGLFSGGPNSNRGYPPRGISPYGNVGFLTPEGERLRRQQNCTSDCRVPTGGFTQWEASAELRVPIAAPFSGALFCDAADVSPAIANVRLSHLHLACGVGARYDTPIGPVRFDVGYRIPGLQVQGGLTPDERAPAPLLGLPIALAVGIGEAF